MYNTDSRQAFSAHSSDFYLDLLLILYLSNSTNLQIVRQQCCLLPRICYFCRRTDILIVGIGRIASSLSLLLFNSKLVCAHTMPLQCLILPPPHSPTIDPLFEFRRIEPLMHSWPSAWEATLMAAWVEEGSDTSIPMSFGLSPSSPKSTIKLLLKFWKGIDYFSLGVVTL